MDVLQPSPDTRRARAGSASSGLIHTYNSRGSLSAKSLIVSGQQPSHEASQGEATFVSTTINLVRTHMW